ncbi:MAG: sugar transferase [Candidatus Symbiothrix sp.]|jgi:exopolysaccharide biosynthesis polyprenyl glycosylphosphotransferase|nr:sugar transferase [Candidatus Symbiothrix sp.]
MKRILYLIVDLLIIYGSIIFTFSILKHINFLEDFQANFRAFEIITPFIGVFYLVLMYAFGLYSFTHKGLSDLIYTVFLVSISLMVGIMGICFFVRDSTFGVFAFPRSVILLSALFYFIFLMLWRITLWIIVRKIHGVKKITLIGNDCTQLAEAITTKYSHLYCIENQCSEDDYQSFSSKIKSVDEVFINSDISQKMKRQILPLCIKYKKDVCFVPTYFDLSIMSSSLSKIDDIPTFRISNMELSPEEHFVKRAIDLIFGTIAFIISLPVNLIITLLVKLDGGPVFYAQERLTEGNRPFKILKFRTMIPNAEKLSGPVLAGEHDPRITKIGRFIRALRLDEIPQLINILKGDMSIVGPRPERPFFVEQFEKMIPEYNYRLTVKAGLTGLAQIEGKYNTSVEDKLRYDLIYINNYSVLKDLLIMLRTVKILFMKESTEGVAQ